MEKSRVRILIDAELGFIDPLIDALERGEPWVLENEHARALLTACARRGLNSEHKLKTKDGRAIRKSKESKAGEILDYVNAIKLHCPSLAMYSGGNTKKPTVAKYTAKHFNVSESVVKAIIDINKKIARPIREALDSKWSKTESETGLKNK